MCDLSSNVEIGVSGIGKGLAEPKTMEKEKHLDSFSFKFIEAARAFRRVIMCWCVRLIVAIRLKSSAQERKMMEESLNL